MLHDPNIAPEEYHTTPCFPLWGLCVDGVSEIASTLPILQGAPFPWSGQHYASGECPPSTSRQLVTGLVAIWLAFLSVWLFATIIPFDVFFAHDSVGISATLFGLPIPQNVIDQVSLALDIPTQYRDFSFCEYFYRPFLSLF